MSQPLKESRQPVTADRRPARAGRAGAARVAYYPGCSLEGLAAEYDRSTRAVCAALGVDLVDIPHWNCCGSTPAHSRDPYLSAALAGRNLALAEELGCDVVMTPCPGCLKSLKGALETAHHPEMGQTLRELLDLPFDGRIRAVSLLQLLLEEVGCDALQQRVQRPLTGRIIVPYYGCLLTRPAAFAQFDDPENPTSMDRLLAAAGATVPAFPFKTECCGATYGVTRNEIVGKLSGRILDMAQRLGAEAVAVACPLCQQNLDLRQDQVNRFWKRSFNLPVVYLPQLLGLALGLTSQELGLDQLFVSAEGLVPDVQEADSGLTAVRR